MHELGIMTGVMDAVTKSAEQAGADKVLKISLSVGEMTECILDALQFAFEALSEGTMCEGAELSINMIKPKSHCLECGAEYEHDRFHMFCPNCDSFATELIAGRELQIDSIEVDIPDDDDEEAASAEQGGEAASERSGQTDGAGQAGEAAPAGSGQPGEPDQPEQLEPPDLAKQPGEPDQPEQPAPTNQSEQPDRA